MVNLDRCDGSCNNFNDPPGRICVANKIENLNINVSSMIRRINERKTLTQRIYHANLNVNLMVQNVIHIKSGKVIVLV